jgi:hypothetical protein
VSRRGCQAKFTGTICMPRYFFPIGAWTGSELRQDGGVSYLETIIETNTPDIYGALGSLIPGNILITAESSSRPNPELDACRNIW